MKNTAKIAKDRLIMVLHEDRARLGGMKTWLMNGVTMVVRQARGWR